MIWIPKEKSMFQKHTEGVDIQHIITDEIRNQGLQIMFYSGEPISLEAKYKIAVDTCVALNVDIKNDDKHK